MGNRLGLCATLLAILLTSGCASTYTPVGFEGLVEFRIKRTWNRDLEWVEVRALRPDVTVTGVEFVIFDDGNGDGVMQAAEFVDKAQARTSIPSSRLHVSGLGIPETVAAPWIRAVAETSMGAIEHSWRLDV